MRKKAQLQLGENVVILVIFFFLLVIAVIFYAGIQKGRIITKQSQTSTLQLINQKTMLGGIPELLCTENSDVTESCIDLINLNAMSEYWKTIKLQENSTDRAYYHYRFGASSIVIKKLNTNTGAWVNKWVLYNNTDNMNYSRLVFIPISLYDVTSDDYAYGLIEFTKYEKSLFN